MSKDRATHDEVVDATSRTADEMRPQRVPVNVYETTGALVIVAPLPAVRPDDVRVTMRGHVVRLTAELRSAGPREHLVNEWEYGGYEREVEVPPGYGAGLEAHLANGQLTVRVLKGEPAGDLDATVNGG